MKNKFKSILTITLATIAGFIFFVGISGFRDLKSGSGSEAGHTGSPGDGEDCTHCHIGPAAENQSGWISSNVPLTGYVSGTEYTITATATRTGHSKFGFQVSPQNNSGSLLGTLKASSSETLLVGSGKYITHSSSGTSGSNGSKSWSFKWTAPPKNTGNVTFYGAFNITDASNNFNGDTIYTSSLLVAENKTVGIDDQSAFEQKIEVYPNPVSEDLNIQYEVSKPSKVEIKIFDLRGRVSDVLLSEQKNAGDHKNSFHINNKHFTKGIYFVEIKIGERIKTQKVLLQ